MADDRNAILDFITDRLAEEERTARAATPGPWITFPEGDIAEWTIYGEGWTIANTCEWPRHHMHNDAIALRMPATVIEHGVANAQHIARHDPARVLRGVEAKRRIVDEWLATSTNPYEGLSDDELHDRRAHPAYEYATTQGQRKAWDYSNEPPWDPDTNEPGIGWERNATASNPEAWERFNYTEESYWRRLRPDGPETWTRYVPNYIRLLASEWSDHPDFQPEWGL